MIHFRIASAALAAALSLSAPAQAACSGTASNSTSIGLLQAGTLPGKGQPRHCTWIVKRIDADGCTIGRVRVESGGPNRGGGGPILGGDARPATIEVERVSDGAVAAMRSTTADGDGWFWTGTNLNCSVLGCGTSRYKVRTVDPITGTCNQTVTVILTTL